MQHAQATNAGAPPATHANLVLTVGSLANPAARATVLADRRLLARTIGDYCAFLSGYEAVAWELRAAQVAAAGAMRGGRFAAGTNPLAADAAVLKTQCDAYHAALTDVCRIAWPIMAAAHRPLTVLGLGAPRLHDDPATDWGAYHRDLHAIFAQASALAEPGIVAMAAGNHTDTLTKPDNAALSDTQQNIMVALRDQVAISANARLNGQAIATAASRGDVNTYKKPLADLVQRGFIQRKTGRGGGYWLTESGMKLAGTL